MGLEGGGNRELLIAMSKTIAMQSFASTVFVGDRGGNGGQWGEAGVLDTVCNNFCVLLPPVQPGGWFAKVPCMNVEDTTSQNKNHRNRFWDAVKLKMTRFFENHKTCVSVLRLWFTHLEESNLLIQNSASSPIKSCAWIRSPLQLLLAILFHVHKLPLCTA